MGYVFFCDGIVRDFGLYKSNDGNWQSVDKVYVVGEIYIHACIILIYIIVILINYHSSSPIFPPFSSHNLPISINSLLRSLTPSPRPSPPLCLHARTNPRLPHLHRRPHSPLKPRCLHVHVIRSIRGSPRGCCRRGGFSRSDGWDSGGGGN
jgi:hypothetical protein